MKTRTRPRVALFFLGGSVIDERGRRGDQVSTPKEIDAWLSNMSETEIIADTAGFYISNGQTAPTLADWSRVAVEIGRIYEEFDGFVVVHDLASIPAAATALHLMLARLGKPVVLVGSTLRSRRQTLSSQFVQEFGAKASFVNAVQVAISNVAEVLVVYGSHIFRGTSVKLSDDQTGFTGHAIGKIDFGIRLFGSHSSRIKRPIQVLAKFEPAVAVVQVFPGFDPTEFLKTQKNIPGIFLNVSELGSLAQVVEQLAKTVGKTIPIVVYTHETSSSLPGVIPLQDPTRSAALVRFMWALGQTRDTNKLKKILGLETT